MEQKKIDRINQLAHKAKADGLTDAEKEEQTALRNEYRRSIVGNFTAQLENCVIVDEKGNKKKVTAKK